LESRLKIVVTVRMGAELSNNLSNFSVCGKKFVPMLPMLLK
jgi:hypothetical protein